MGGPGDYKAGSFAFVPWNQLGQITRLLLSTCKITRRWLTGNMHLSRKIMSNQSNFLHWKGNRSCGQQRNSSVIYLDLSKLSDALSPDYLTGKLRKCGLDEWLHNLTIQWLHNLLENSTQKVVTNGSLSKCKDAPAGFVQGSVCSLVIFNIFINYQYKVCLLNLQMTRSWAGVHTEDRYGIKNYLIIFTTWADKQ